MSWGWPQPSPARPSLIHFPPWSLRSDACTLSSSRPGKCTLFALHVQPLTLSPIPLHRFGKLGPPAVAVQAVHGLRARVMEEGADCPLRVQLATRWVLERG